MKIFLSYGHDKNKNPELVQRIRADLEKPENGGHDVWIDTAEIKFGDNWRRQISDGIQNSDWMLAFLSKHSVREPGVCRDELAIALGTNGKIISTVLLESPDEAKPPVSVSHIQWLDMADWQTKQAEGTAAFEAWYSEKFVEIRRVLDNPLTQRFSGEIEYLAGKLDPVPYSARVGKLLGKGFVGREWLAKEIDDWRQNDPDRRVFCITGEPGIGKSAIAAWLAHTNKADVVAVHFCDYQQPNWADTGQIIRSIAFQMATRLDDYRRFLIGAVDTLERQGAVAQQQQMQSLLQAASAIQAAPDQLQAMLAQFKPANSLAALEPAELFDGLLANPAIYGIGGGRQRSLIIIDALDEAGAQLAEFIAQRADSLPPWLAFVVTSRPGESAIMAHLEKLHPRVVQADDPRNRDDLRDYIREWLDSRNIDAQQQARIIEPLLAASEGNFLYLATFRDFVEQGGEAGRLALEKPDSYPKGISSLYFSFFQRQFPNQADYRERMAPFLRLVAAARRPLPEKLAQRILGLDEETFKTQVLQPLGSLFRRQEGAIEPFHKSLRDWLSDDTRSQGYFVSTSDGHRRLGEILWQDYLQNRKQPDSLSDYAITEMPHHLLAWSDDALSNLIPEVSVWEDIRSDANVVANAQKEAIRWREAETWWRLILRLDEHLLGPEHMHTAASLSNLAGVLCTQGKRAEAEPLNRRSVLIMEKRLGPEHPDTATALNNLAVLLSYRGNYNEAEPLHQRALAIREKTLGPEHPVTATSVQNLASLLYLQGNFSKAELLFRRSLAVQEKTFGPEHPNTADSLNNLAGVLAAGGNFADAEPLHRRALAIREKTLGPEHPDTATSLLNLAGLLRVMGNTAEAEPLCHHSLAILEKVFGPEHPVTAAGLNSLAFLLADEDKYAEAEPLFRRALAINEQALGPEHPDTATSLNNLAGLLEAQGDTTEAGRLYPRALAILEKAFGPKHPSTIETHRRLAVYLREMGQFSKAETLLKQVIDDRCRTLGELHEDTLIVQSGLGKFYRLMDKAQEAHNTLNDALDKAVSALGKGHAVTLGIQEELDLLLPMGPIRENA